MKTKLLLNLSAVALFGSLNAAVTFESGFSGTAYYSHSTTDSVISFDWAGGDLFAMTSAGYPDVKVWKHSGAGLTSIYSNPANYAGASLVTIGDYVYFNDSDFSNIQYIRKYGPLSGTSSTTQISTAYNWGLYGHDGDLFITGAVGWGTNQIFHSALNSSGDLVSDPATSLGTTSGASGPIAFDALGNLFYAPGFGDLSIYRWSAAEVAAAIIDPASNPLSVAGALWHDYSADFATAGGGTGMVVSDEDNLLLTLTNFTDPSQLVEFQTDGSGAFAGYQGILSSTDRLGDLRYRDGEIYVAAGNQIFEVTAVPEPAVFALYLGLLSLGSVAVRRKGRPSPARATGRNG